VGNGGVADAPYLDKERRAMKQVTIFSNYQVVVSFEIREQSDLKLRKDIIFIPKTEVCEGSWLP
jgi:hypothetical protein